MGQGFTIWGFPKIGGTIWGLCNQDDNILGVYIEVPLFCGNSHLSVRVVFGVGTLTSHIV